MTSLFRVPRRLQHMHLKSAPFFIALILAAGSFTPVTAHAQAVAACTIIEKIVFNPPVTLQPQNVTLTLTDLAACPTGAVDTSAVGVELPATVFTVPNFSCASFISPPTPIPVDTYTWSDGMTSMISGTNDVMLVANVLNVVVDGKVIAGKFLNDSAKFTKTFVATDIAACQSGNGTQVHSLYGYGTLLITKPLLGLPILAAPNR